MTTPSDHCCKVPSILIVDDNPDSLRMLCDLLIEQGWKVRPVSDGMLALQAAAANPPDLILLDVLMPGMDGFQVCAALKENPLTRPVPIIMVTALTEKQDKLRGLEAGADDFLSKPFDRTELLVRTQNLLRVKEYGDFLKSHNEILEQQVRLRCEELEAAHDELKKAQSHLVQQEKMATIGLLMAGVAHEINNPVGYISSNLDSLRKYGERLSEFIAAQDEALQCAGMASERLQQLRERRKKLKIDHVLADLPQVIRESAEGTERLKAIIQNLKCFSRRDNAERTLADINQCLENALGIVHNELKYKASVRCEYGELPKTLCYPQELGQVFINLLVNAAHAIEDAGEIRVRTRLEGGLIRVSVSDTGCGIPENIRRRIFEPFFTTKEIGKGTGLGLAISTDIIRKHGGDIGVESEPGKGTTFTVSIPVISA